MKRAGLVIFIAGLVITVITGFNFVTTETVVDAGKLQITWDKNHTLVWSPLLGVATMVAGGAIFAIRSKRQ